MKKIVLIVVVLILMMAIAVPAFADPPTCNWGEFTSTSIAAGHDQGGHASDPGEDGLGYEDRVGLANVFGQGDLELTCSTLNPDS